MAQERPLTPEKQLLNLIEGSSTAALRTEAIKHRSFSLFSPGAWLGRIAFFKGRVKRQAKGAGRYELNIKIINRLLAACVLILTYYLGESLYTAISLRKKPQTAPEVRQEAVKPASFQGESAFVSQKAVSYFLEKVRQRDIFRIGPRPPEAPPQVTDKGASSRIMEATKHLKLVGISWSNDPDAMVEDTKAVRTFFVKRGQMIGELKVQAIFRDKIILEYAGEEIELR